VYRNLQTERAASGYPYAGSFVKSVILGRYLIMNSVMYKPPPHAGMRTNLVQLILDHPEHFDMRHFTKYDHQQIQGVNASMMIAVQEAMRQHHDQTARYYSTLANIRHSPHAATTLGVSVADLSDTGGLPGFVPPPSFSHNQAIFPPLDPIAGALTPGIGVVDAGSNASSETSLENSAAYKAVVWFQTPVSTSIPSVSFEVGSPVSIFQLRWSQCRTWRSL
jgi:hypothetical protein